MNSLPELSPTEPAGKLRFITLSVCAAVGTIIVAYSLSDTVQRAVDRDLLKPILKNFIPVYEEGETTVPYLPSSL